MSGTQDTPDHGASATPYRSWAEQMVALSAEDPMLRGLAVRLDWTPASIAGIDACLDAVFGTAGEAPGQDEWRPSQGRYNLILGFGADLGEVCRGIVGGTWQEDPDQPHPVRARLAMVVFGNPEHVARLKRKPISEYNYLISPEMSRELKKMLGEMLS
jgi:hypothetical protein